MPNGHAYEPVPIEQYDAAIAEERRRIAARGAIGAVRVAADLLGVSFAEMVDLMSAERQVDRLFDALANPTPPPEPADVPVTAHEAPDHDPDDCLTCIRHGWSPRWKLVLRSASDDGERFDGLRGDPGDE